ncbi:ATP-binding protein [Ekhidna sp.]|uniref:sensor histidine kinase n=1 Tax=Ekhidna sp. TaxID=2608089 RepID=UPI0032974988
MSKIGNKLALIMIGLAMIVTTFLATLFYYQFDQALKERVLLQLSSVKQLKLVKIKAEISDRIALFGTLKNELSPSVKTAGFLAFTKSETQPTQIGEYRLPDDVNWSGRTYLIDFTEQHPSRKITIGFARRTANNYILAVAQITEIQEILLERTGLGATGESYLVGNDYQLKSRSRFDLPYGKGTTVKTNGVLNALSGKAGEDSFLDYRGVHVFSSYDKIQFNGLTWVMLSEINYDEAMEPIVRLRKNLLAIVAIIMAFILIASYYVSNMLVSPIISMEKKLIRMSEGVLDDDFVGKKREDEIGHMFRALNKLIHALGETIRFADEIGSGNFTAEFKPLGPHDKLGSSLVEMKEKLQQYHENELLHQKENQRSILSGEEKERSRLAQELHDGLGPILTTLRLDIQSTSINQKLKQQLLKKLDYTIQEVRNMSNNLMPSVLKDFGVGEAITNMVKEIDGSSAVSIRFKHDIPLDAVLEDQIQISIYRIVQEAINNSLKHSNATDIKLSLTYFEDHLDLFISDNGQGFDVNELGSGNGIRNMKERVKLLSGSISIQSSSRGTTIEIEIPNNS